MALYQGLAKRQIFAITVPVTDFSSGPAPVSEVDDVLRAGQATLHLTDDDLNGMRTELRDASDERRGRLEAAAEL